jgi:endonuclease/exonuclease/phosphatase (EEP) superfamily protein YafD
MAVVSTGSIVQPPREEALPSPEPRRRRRRRREIAWAIPALLVAIFAAVLPHLDLYSGAVVPVLQSLLPVGSVVLALLAVVLLVARVRAAAIILFAGALAAIVPTLTPIHPAPACDARTPLTVLSFNAKFAHGDPAELAKLIRAQKPDVVVLVETDETMIDALLGSQGLRTTFPYRTGEVTPGGVDGGVILSSYPLRDEERIPGSVFDQVTAIATLPDGSDLRLAAVHPPSPVGQPSDWHHGVSAIHSWIDRTSDPRLVMAGDFNSSFAHPVFRALASSLTSAAQAAGPIPWPTWPQEKPVPAFTAIDHILARGATPTGWASFHIDGSDHRAVVGNWKLCAPASTE